VPAISIDDTAVRVVNRAARQGATRIIAGEIAPVSELLIYR
jgi:hypothetical protein